MQSRFQFMIAVAVVACGSFVAVMGEQASPQTGPATHPTTRPARIPIPAGETPLAAIRRGAAVYDQLDLEYAMELFDYSTEEQKQYVRSECRYAIALTGVEHAVKERFGKKVSDKMIHAVGEHSAEDFDGAKFDNDGDKVAVHLEGEEDPVFTMVHVNGVWKLSAADAIADLDAETIKGMNEWEDDMAHDLPKLEQDIRDGKYKTPEEAIGAVKDLVNPKQEPPEEQVPTQKA